MVEVLATVGSLVEYDITRLQILPSYLLAIFVIVHLISSSRPHVDASLIVAFLQELAAIKSLRFHGGISIRIVGTEESESVIAGGDSLCIGSSCLLEPVVGGIDFPEFELRDPDVSVFRRGPGKQDFDHGIVFTLDHVAGVAYQARTSLDFVDYLAACRCALVDGLVL